MSRAKKRDLGLSAIDLNLLVALDALLKEAHVTRAARRIGLSQSAMSHSLTRLRDLLGDPILVRAGRGMVLTSRAQQIAAPLADALRSLEHSLGAARPFDAARLNRTFRVAAIDFAQLVLIPPLMTRLLRDAPGVSLVVLPAVEPIERALADGTIDLAVGLERDLPGVRQQFLLTEKFVSILRRGHPAAAQRMTPKRVASLPHALVSVRGRVTGAFDTALREVGLSRRVVLTVPQTLPAALVLARSDVVLTVAERVARMALRGLPIDVFEPALPLKPFRVSMMWHSRHDGDAAHAFLRDQLADVAKRA